MNLLTEFPIISGNYVKLEEGGEIVAFVEYDWVKDTQDMLRADRGEHPEGGPVLYLSNLRIAPHRPDLIWKLKRKLPKAKWIVGMQEDYTVVSPRGVPDDFVA